MWGKCSLIPDTLRDLFLQTRCITVQYWSHCFPLAFDNLVHARKRVWTTNRYGSSSSVINAEALWDIHFRIEHDRCRPFDSRPLYGNFAEYLIYLHRCKVPWSVSCLVRVKVDRSNPVLDEVDAVFRQACTLKVFVPQALEFREHLQKLLTVLLKLGG